MKSIYTAALSVFAIAAGLVWTQAAFAHHSSAGFSNDPKTIVGVVKEFQFKNPHSWIQVNVTDATGKTMEWSVEWGSPNQLGRDGIRPSTFPAGAQVTIKLRPDLTGAPIGLFIGAKMGDGKTIGRWEGGAE